MSAKYQHKQTGGWLLLIGLLSIPVWGLFAWYAMDGVTVPAWLLAVMAVALLVMTAALWTFSSLTVTVSDVEVELAFGPGFFKKRFSLAEVRSATPVRNAWWYGWGIRLTPHGWLYNVSGFDAVELQLITGRKVRIGTDEPQALARAVTQAAGLS